MSDRNFVSQMTLYIELPRTSVPSGDDRIWFSDRHRQRVDRPRRSRRGPPPGVGARRLAGERVAPTVAHDFAYRLARHAGTITRDVYDSVSREIGELPFVELCAVVSTVAAVWQFRRNIGAPMPPLPATEPGEPTGRRPAQLAEARLNWVPVAAPADQVAAVVQAYTGVPDEYANTWRMADAQYMPQEEMVDPAWSRRQGGLSRPPMEVVPARVTKLRECFY